MIAHVPVWASLSSTAQDALMLSAQCGPDFWKSAVTILKNVLQGLKSPNIQIGAEAANDLQVTEQYLPMLHK